MFPTISAVIPTYNRGELAVRAVESVLNQTRQPEEIILVDDGSLDDTRQLISQYEHKVTYLYQENSGSAVARNNGIQNAKSEWIALLDSDDTWDKEYLSRMKEIITLTQGVGNYYFADTIMPPEKGGGSLWQALDFHIDGNYEIRQNGTEWAIMNIQPMMLQSTIIKRSSFLAVG